MIKLYKRDVDRIVSYHEAWVAGAKIVEHWGALGDRGETRDHARRWWRGEGAHLEAVLAAARSAGFGPARPEDESVVLVEYRVDGFGTDADLAKRHALEGRLNETLGWTGLGNCDGGSIGSGTMEVACLVVDVEVARRVIAADLVGTEFADYSRVFAEDAG